MIVNRYLNEPYIRQNPSKHCWFCVCIAYLLRLKLSKVNSVKVLKK